MQKIIIILKSIFLFILLFAGTGHAQTNITIQHIPLTKFSYPGKIITFKAIVTPLPAVAAVTLMYRSKGEPFYSKFQAMKTNNDPTNYFCRITNTEETKYSLEYRILVQDTNLIYTYLPQNSSYLLDISTSQIDLISPDTGGVIILPDDIGDDEKVTSLTIPSLAVFEATYFGIEYYPYDSIAAFLDLNHMSVLNHDLLVDGQIPTALYYFFKWDDGSCPFSFRKSVSVSLRYFEEDGITDENKLNVFYWDEIRWRKTGSLINTNHNTIQFDCDFIGYFGIFETLDTTVQRSSQLLDFVANPSFCPEQGDIVIFGLKENISDFRIIIMTPQGKTIRELKTRSWDGRNTEGHMVQSGIYIYQITALGKTISGMVCVIK
ncbi:MAG: hypothetical protein JW827_07240 [Spirochaetes bacterium]|nr:hypothetical protein [Spirochaetota bacterium]